jgi:hypothetical protein
MHLNAGSDRVPQKLARELVLAVVQEAFLALLLLLLLLLVALVLGCALSPEQVVEEQRTPLGEGRSIRRTKHLDVLSPKPAARCD